MKESGNVAAPPTVSTPAVADWAAKYAGGAREVYRKTLQELAERDARIWCVDSDTGNFEDTFATALPGQYVNLGIAEANLMSVAAALAAAGKIPFVNTMATFATGRAFEQIKLDVAYNNVPVKIVGTHGGTSAGHLGPTHQALEDLALMRVLPNMTVMVPADAAEAAKAVEKAAYLPGPVYIRLDRKATPVVYDQDYDFVPGQAVTLLSGRDVTIVATGAYPVVFALEAARRLTDLGVSVRVLNVHTLKPLDVEAVGRAARETRGLVTVEDHSVIGGLGSAVAEAVAEHCPAPVRRVGVRDRFCDQVGGHLELLAACEVTPERVMADALALCR